MENKERKETINKFARVNISKLWEKRTLRTFHTFFYLRSKEGILQSIFLQIFRGLHSMNRYRVIWGYEYNKALHNRENSIM